MLYARLLFSGIIVKIADLASVIRRVKSLT